MIERFPNLRRNALILTAGLGAVGLTGCSALQNLNPSKTATFAAASNAGATEQIKEIYPHAYNITMHEAQDNPDYMSWDLPNGEHCTAVSSAVSFRQDTSGDLLTQPWCRHE